MARIVWVVLGTVAMTAASAAADFEYWRHLSLPGTVRDVAVDPTEAQVVWIAKSNANTVQGDLGTPYGAGVARSSDGGETFVDRNAGLTNLHVTSIAIDPSTPSTVWVATKGGGVFRTTDAGLSWSPRNGGLGGLDVYAIAVDPQTPTTVFAGLRAGGVYRSTDAGASWAAATGMGNLTVRQIAVDPTTPATVYVASSGGVRKSVDGGVSFASTGTMTVQEAGEAPEHVSDANAVVIDTADPVTVYAGLHSGAGVFKSTDGGATWSHTSTGLLSRWGNWRFVHRLAQDPITPTTLYAATSGGIYRSIDAGATWVVFNGGLSRDEAYALATTSTGGAFIASVYGDFHELATKPSGVDHLRCLKARGKGFTQRTVAVDDRFGTGSVTLLKPYRLCTPTSVSGDPVADPTTHLLCYRVRGGAVPPIAISFLTDRLDGYRAYQVNKHDTLCVPANVVGVPSAQPRDAYRCMRGPRWTSDTLDLLLADGFGTQPVRDSRVDRLCGPTDVDGAGRLEPDVGLRCDKLIGPKSAPSPSTVAVEDQFGTLTLKLQRADSHCVQVLDSRN